MAKFMKMSITEIRQADISGEKLPEFFVTGKYPQGKIEVRPQSMVF